MQNKPNFIKSQMNLNPYNAMDYENIANWTLGKNKPNLVRHSLGEGGTNPICSEVNNQ